MYGRPSLQLASPLCENIGLNNDRGYTDSIHWTSPAGNYFWVLKCIAGFRTWILFFFRAPDRATPSSLSLPLPPTLSGRSTCIAAARASDDGNSLQTFLFAELAADRVDLAKRPQVLILLPLLHDLRLSHCTAREQTFVL